jgi:hypothetical protein
MVMRLGASWPSVATSHRSLTDLSASKAGSSTENIARLPSGLTIGAPTRFMLHKASKVIGFRVSA